MKIISRYVLNDLKIAIAAKRLFLLVLITCLLMVISTPLPAQQPEYIELKNRRELFIDDFLIENTVNISHRLSCPIPGPGGIKADKPWEGKYLTYATIVKTDSVYKMYYRGSDEIRQGLTEAVTCYAKSIDGIN